MIPTNSELEDYIKGLHEQIKCERDRVDALITAYSKTVGELSIADQAMHVRLSAVEYKTRDIPGFIQAQDGEWRVVCTHCGAVAETIVVDVMRDKCQIDNPGFYCEQHGADWERKGKTILRGGLALAVMVALYHAVDSA